MGFWFAVIVIVALTALSYALAPKMKNPSGSMSPDEKLRVPTCEEGRSVGVVFGTVWVEDPVVAWHGDLLTTAIRK